MVYTDGVYLIANTIKELERLVAAVNLPQQYLNSATHFPHYRITDDHVESALQGGAKKVTSEKLQSIAKKILRFL